MKKATIRPRCVLLDANIVIEAHKLGVWDQMKKGYQLTLPAIVSRQEALFWFDNGHKTTIDLLSQIKGKEIGEVAASVSELQELYRIFEHWFLETLDPGETEALALLNSGRVSNASFCTGDAPAIKALIMIGMPGMGISFETLLKQIGLNKNLETPFLETFHSNCCKQGGLNLVTRNGLQNKKLV